MKLKFISDGTLGRLARWLRAIGYDTVFEPRGVDRDFLNRARREERIVLSRRRDLVNRNFRGRMIILQSDRIRDQIRELKEKVPELEIKPENLFTICLECNSDLREVPKESVENLVPPYVYETQARFMQCLKCGKIYWAGTHRERAEKFLSDLLA
ncbi:MAG: Mut7-C RNAse domain-containing protein [Syntrophaceae bacterium]